MFDPPSQPSPGWFPDPHRPGTRRWWNGREWEAVWDDGRRGDDLHGDYLHADGLPDIGHWLSTAFSASLRRWRATTAVALITTVPATVLTSVGLSRLADGVVIDEDGVSGWTGDRLGVVVPMLVAAVLLTALGGVAITVLMLRTFDGEPAAADTGSEFRSGWSAVGGGLKVLPRMIGWSMVAFAAFALIAAVVVVLMVIAVPLGVIVMLILIPFAVLMSIRLAFVGVSIVDRPGQPFSRSIEVARGRFWGVLGRLLLLGIIVWLCSVVLQTATGIVSGSGFGNAFGNNQFQTDENGAFSRIDLAEAFPSVSVWTLVVSAFVAIATAVIVSSVSAAAGVHLYRGRNPAE